MVQGQMSYREAIEKVLAEVDGPIAVDDCIARVLAIRPSQAKNPRSAVRTKLREEEGNLLVFLDKKTIASLRVAMQGVRFRVPLSKEEVKRGIAFVNPGFYPFIQRAKREDLENIRLLDNQGRPLPVSIVCITKKKSNFFFGEYTADIYAFDLSDWLRSHKARPGDSILVTVEDWEAQSFRLEYESKKERRRHRDEIARKNQELADIFFAMLEESRTEQIFVHKVIFTAFARLRDPRGYPGDHWTTVLEQDPRMRYDGIMIRYSDSFTPFERLFMEMSGKAIEIPEKRFTTKEGRQAYRFKAYFKHRKGIWRRIEILGKQTLADFDLTLRTAFGHDTTDHLSGFWKLVPRGKGRRVRRVELGDINPLGKGSGANLHIAGLGLQPGDKLEYVYDFGDWIEHVIELEDIGKAEKGVQYPRITEQNKPRYRYCQSCKAKGRKTVATYICITCSNEQQREVLVCEDCLMAEHEDHYAEEIVY